MKSPAPFDILVEQPFNDTNEYVFDKSANAIRLDRVARVGHPDWTNRGVIANSVTSRGDPLRVYLISELPIAPHVHVHAHAVGAFERTANGLTDRIIVAVPCADERYASVRSLQDLPDRSRAAIQQSLDASTCWLDANAAEELVHQARQRARLGQIGKRDLHRFGPEQEPDSSRALLDHLARKTDLHTQAEAVLSRLPYRFQKYIRLCLAENERILYWVHRPKLTLHGIWNLARRILPEGLLLVTDQQALWILEPVTPTVAIERYGYVARSISCQMLGGVAVEEKEEYLALTMISANAMGRREKFSIEFPLAARQELQEAARLLGSFLPTANETRLRRLSTLDPKLYEIDDPTENDNDKTRTTLNQLRTIVAARLHGETIYAEALVPSWAEGGPQLLTVTDKNLYLTSHPKRSNHDAFSLQAVIASEFCFSVLGSWLKLHLPPSESIEIAFPLTAFKSFNACWRAIGRLSAI